MQPLLLVDAQWALTASAQLVQSGNDLLCSPAVTFLQLQGAVLLLLLSLGWLLAGLQRAKEVQRRLRQPRSAATGHQKWWPGVTVILPVKGCKKHTLRNWESQLAQEYAGSLEYLFVVDSREDPAFPAASQLAAKAKGKNARIIVAGPCRTNSQKIHNIQAGIQEADGMRGVAVAEVRIVTEPGVQAARREHEFVLSVDDDVSLHPTTLGETIAAVRSCPGTFMVTGYPFDIPGEGANLLAYSVLSYHLPLLIAFSLQQKTQFVWGGFMLFRLQDLLADTYGIMKAWSGGGYSDDLIAAAKCGEQGLQILCPPFTVFPQWLDGEYDWRRYWNYLRRQLYVMDTYHSPLNKRINHTMMLLHSYLSLAFTLPATTVAIRLVLWVAATVLLPAQKVYVGPGTSLRWLGSFGASLCPWSSISLAAFVVALAAAVAALRWMSGVLLTLFHSLSPRADPIDAGCFHWLKLWLGFYLNNCLVPACALYTRLTASVVWSGVRYMRRDGRIVHIRRCDGLGQQWRCPRKSIDSQVA